MSVAAFAELFACEEEASSGGRESLSIRLNLFALKSTSVWFAYIGAIRSLPTSVVSKTWLLKLSRMS